MPDAATIKGYCPMGCGETLFVVATDGHITCGSLTCQQPDAAAQILADQEVEHVVQFGLDDFVLRHPLRERLPGALPLCELHDYIADLGGPPVQPGRYRARRSGGRWTWEAMPDGD